VGLFYFYTQKETDMTTQTISQPTHNVKETLTAPIAPTILPTVIEQTARNVFESFSEKMKAALNGREDRALKLALEGHVAHKSARVFSVRSEDNQHAYLVNLDKGFCTCPDSQKGHVCKHRLAAYIFEQASKAHQELSPEPPIPTSIPPQANEPRPLNPDEEALEKARFVLNARSQHLREAIIYAVLDVEGEPLQVELINLEGEVALVRALPKVKDGKLVPQFPFPERKSLARVIAKSLSEVCIYR
jgi:hypothetical protein